MHATYCKIQFEQAVAFHGELVMVVTITPMTSSTIHPNSKQHEYLVVAGMEWGSLDLDVRRMPAVATCKPNLRHICSFGTELTQLDTGYIMLPGAWSLEVSLPGVLKSFSKSNSLFWVIGAG